MSYCIRLLAPEGERPTATHIEGALRSEGFEVSVEAQPDELHWSTLVLRLPGHQPVLVRHSRREGDENPVDAVVDDFLDELLELDDTPQVAEVEGALRRARQMTVVEVPEAFPWGGDRTAVDALVEFLADRTQALIQADGEGFYNRDGDLLVPLG